MDLRKLKIPKERKKKKPKYTGDDIRAKEQELNELRLKKRNQLKWMCLPVAVILYVFYAPVGFAMFGVFLYLLLKKPKPLVTEDESFVKAVGEKIFLQTLKGVTLGVCKDDSLEPVESAGLFPETVSLSGRRWVKGVYKDTPFHYFDLQAKTTEEEPKELFRGGWYIFSVDAPEDAELRLISKKTDPIAGTDEGLVPVMDERLDGRFTVKATDAEGAGLITPELCGQALALRKLSPGMVLCYKKGKLHVGMSDGLLESFSLKIYDMANNEKEMCSMIQEDVDRIMQVIRLVVKPMLDE